MRHLARENRMFVVGVNPVLHADQVPAGFPGRERLLAPAYLERNGPWPAEGNTVVAAPDVFRLHADTSPRPAVIETSGISHQPYGGPDEDPISA